MQDNGGKRSQNILFHEDEDDEKEVLEEDEVFIFPFRDSTLEEQTDQDEISAPVSRRSRSVKERETEYNKGAFMELPQLIEGEVKNIKRREIDCDHRRRWQGHCLGTSRQDKDRISDSMATTRDFRTKVG